MLHEDAILRIRGSCDCNGGKLDDENRFRKNRKQILKTVDEGNWLRKLRPKKSEMSAGRLKKSVKCV